LFCVAFALVRFAYDAFQGCLAKVNTCIDDPTATSVSTRWSSFLRTRTTHRDYIVSSLFPLMEETFADTVISSGVYDLYSCDKEELEKMNLLLPSSHCTAEEWANFKEAWQSYYNVQLERFIAEEKIIRSFLRKLSPRSYERALFIHDSLIIPTRTKNLDDWLFYISFCVEHLSHHKCPNPMALTSAYIRGLKASSLTTEWEEYLPLIKSSCLREIWSDMNSKYDLESSWIAVLSTNDIVVTAVPVNSNSIRTAQALPKYYDNEFLGLCCKIS
jgi:hypothetical protein